ncbi:unnamed protein product [Periconia digitata]|uniref:Glycosyltransferase family 69 protein n=1 Tax=Periconia digitata TaxID=1303443 RepID=A0A9W4UE83_9PLEO|nr:unnamed protein product [Periconia digitata]
MPTSTMRRMQRSSLATLHSYRQHHHRYEPLPIRDIDDIVEEEDDHGSFHPQTASPDEDTSRPVKTPSWVSSVGEGFTYSRGAGQRGYTELGDGDDGHEWDDDDNDDGHYDDKWRGGSKKASWAGWLGGGVPLPTVKGFTNRKIYAHYLTPRRRKRSVLRCIYWTVFSFPYACLFLVLIAATLFPSYTYHPPHYTELRRRAEASREPGRANVYNEKVFIAASIYEKEGALTSGAWGNSMRELVDLLGPENVHLSLYENDADGLTKQSLARFERNLPCNKTIVSEDLDLHSLPRVALPNPAAAPRIKRIAFLADVRNKALAPLSTATQAGIRFDRLLYVNDVNFDPVDAAQLLLSTNRDPRTGRANYAAACAVDFINAFKFYDRFALRDTEGHPPGIPFFPWFTSEGEGKSRKDVLAGKDAVRVKSCWGGMTAFEARWFQEGIPTTQSGTGDDDEVAEDARHSTSTTATATKPAHNETGNATANPEPLTGMQIAAPLRFRYNPDPFWDSSECCLIHADLAFRLRQSSSSPLHLPTASSSTTEPGEAHPADDDDTRIYMNPFIRVAYDPTTLSYLPLVRRPEKLYALIHDILNRCVGFPGFNPRRSETPGHVVSDVEWVPLPRNSTNIVDDNGEWMGKWKHVQRVAGTGGFCGTRQLLVINEDRGGDGDGERWSKVELPPPPPPP